MNSIQSNRLHRIKYRLATIPPIRYLANNVVESKFFKNAISYIVWISTVTLILKTSLVVEYERSYPTATAAGTRLATAPLNFDWLLLNRDGSDDATIPYHMPRRFLQHINYIADNGTSYPCEEIDCDDSDDVSCSRSVFEFIVTMQNGAPHYQDYCKKFIQNNYRELWFLEINHFFKVLEMAVMVAFAIEVFLYWLDDFTEYWKNFWRIFDFVITVLCFLQWFSDTYMDNKVSDAFQNSNTVCPIAKFEGSKYEIQTLCDAAQTEPMVNNLLVILANRQNVPVDEQKFLGTPIRRFCHTIDQSTIPSFLWTYFCEVSNPYGISMSSIIGYYGIFTIIKACRFFKITVSDKRVRDIIRGVQKALSQMYLILLLLLIMLVLFSLLFNTMLQNKNSDPDSQWTYQEFKTKMEVNMLNVMDEKVSVFTGFIDIWWTLAILFQMMTLDQWGDTFNSVQTAHFHPIMHQTNCSTSSFCDMHWTAISSFFNPYGCEEWEISYSVTWLLMFFLLFLWLWLGNFVFKNLTTGIIVNSFLQDSNEKRWAENEAIVEKELANIAGEIAGEVKNDGDATEEFTDFGEEEDLYLTKESHRIQQIEAESEYMRDNICKPWKWPYVTKMFPNLQPRIDNISNKLRSITNIKSKIKKSLNKVNSLTLDDSDEDFGAETTSSTIMGRRGSRLSKNSRISSMGTTLGNDLRINIEARPSLLRQRSNQANVGMGNTLNIENQIMNRRLSAISIVSTQKMHKIAGTINGKNHRSRSIDTANTFSTNSSRSIKSGDSLFSRLSEKRSLVYDEAHSNDFDLTQWELAVQVHMDKTNGYPKESLWPRDTLFRYYQVMERIQENLQERKEILRFFTQSMMDDHDT